MFEHLSPTIDSKKYKKSSRWAMFLPALFFSVFIFLFSSGISQGPSGKALVDDSDFSANLYVDSNDKQIVYLADNISLFDFVLEPSSDGAHLRKLKINVSGVYDLGLLENLKLYNDKTQLGTIKELDDQGNIYFDLKDYQLAKGENYFSLRVLDNTNLREGDILKFAISERADLSLIYQASVFMPKANYPAESGNISFISRGYLEALNADNSHLEILASNTSQKITSFDLLSYGETVDLKALNVVIKGENADGAKFALIKENKLLATALAEGDNIVFSLAAPITINKKESFEIQALSLPVGEFELSLAEVLASGYNSGIIVDLKASLLLANFEVRPYYLEFKNSNLDTNLSLGWNKLYQLDLKSVGIDTLELYKLTWLLDYQGIEISEAELWIDNQLYIADLVLSDDNRLIAKAGWETPLVIKSVGSKIDLLVKVDKLEKKARIAAYLLNDKESMSGDDLSSNIIFSDGDNFFSSYKLPYLPLVPTVLSK